MQTMTLKDVEKLALLARIEMPEAEKQDFLDKIPSILEYIGQIQEFSGEAPEKKIGDNYNVMRDDENPRDSGMYTEKILAQAPEKQDGYFKVKKIL